LSRNKLPESIHPVRLAKVVAIQHSHPKLYALLREVPRLLRDLEAYFRTEADLGDAPAVGAANRPATSPFPPQLQTFVGQTTLRRLLTLHPADMPDVNIPIGRMTAVRTHTFTPNAYCGGARSPTSLALYGVPSAPSACPTAVTETSAFEWPYEMKPGFSEKTWFLIPSECLVSNSLRGPGF